MNYRQSHTQEGFTFMELVVAILILGILGTIGVTYYIGFAEDARRKTTETNLKTLKQNIDLFHLQLNSYPSKLDDLAQRPAGDLGKKWARPFVAKVPQDAWGYDFKYKPTPGGKHPYELYSFGGSDGPNEDVAKRIDGWNL